MKRISTENTTVLNLLGASRDYMGTKFLEVILDLTAENEESLTNISKLLYAECAKICNTSAYCIERDIRTIVKLIWDRGNRTLLEEIAGKKLEKCPSNGEFICYMTDYLREHFS